MSTRIPPSTIAVPSGINRPRDARDSREKQSDLRKYASPTKAHLNYIPSPDALRTMIERALEALSNGVYWQRGSIINLVL